MITSRVLYKHSHTPPASAQPWQPGHQELDPALRAQREKSKHDSRIHKVSNPCSTASSGLGEKQRNIPYVTAVPVQKSLAGSRKTLSNRCLFRSCSTFDSDNTGPHIESDTNHYLHWTAFAARRTPAAVCCLSRSKETCNAEQLGEYYKNTFQSIIDQVILEIYSVLGLYH